MSLGRNEPCHCGSGKKYKACCLGRDQARSSVEAAVGSTLFRASDQAWQAAAREAPVWEAEVAPVPVRVGDDREEAPALALVTAAGSVVHGEVLPQRPAGAGERAGIVADALAQSAGVLGAWPGRVRVRDQALADALAGELAPRGVAVEAAPVPELDEALDSALEHLCDNPVLARYVVPVRWAETEAAPAVLADFHAAVAEFHGASPWEELGDEPLLLAYPDGTEWAATVMATPEERGIVLYSDPDDLLDLIELTEEEAGNEQVMEGMVLNMRGLWLTVELHPRTRLSRPMQREVAAAGWPVANPSAYPVIVAARLPERRVTAEHLSRATLALRAVALVARQEDPEPATGVHVAMLLPSELWDAPEEAAPICAEGAGAAPERALTGPAEVDDIAREEGERLERFAAWLPKHPTRAEDLLNAGIWRDFLVAQAVPAGAATEFDLRLFLYLFYPAEGNAPELAARLLTESMDRLFRFMEEREEIRYPWAERVLRELDQMERETGAPLEELLDEAQHQVHDDLLVRMLIPDPKLGAGVRWPHMSISQPLLPLRRDLHRRWLLWHDELVRAGTTNLDALEEALVERQRGWATTPNELAGGRTPLAVVAEFQPSVEEESG